MRAPVPSTILGQTGCVGSTAMSKPIAIAVACGLAALVVADGSAFAQAGSTGGTIGKTDKSVSGGEDQPQTRQRSKASSASKERPTLSSISGKWLWTAKCDDASEWAGGFDIAQKSDGRFSGTISGLFGATTISGQLIGNKLIGTLSYLDHSTDMSFTLAAGGNSMHGSETSKARGICTYQVKRA